MNTKNNFIIVFIVLLCSNVLIKNIHGWKYQTKCTIPQSSVKTNDFELNNNNNNNLIDSIENNNENDDMSKIMNLKCPNVNDFLFIGLTQYGVSSSQTKNKNNNNNNNNKCQINQDDCLVTVDYLANECNGLNSCNIQLESQFLHLCKNNSDYLSIAYECIPGAKRVDVCSNDELYIIDSSTTKSTNDDIVSRFGSFYLSSPNYPNEYANNLNNCSCKINYVHIDDNGDKKDELENLQNDEEINLVFKTFEFDMEEAYDDQHCNKDYLQVESLNQKTNMTTESFKLCGQYKDFNEFYARGNSLKLNLKSDDVISRRGFLVKISPTQQTRCPLGSERFNNEKCIRLFNDTKLNYHEANRSCQSLNGRLLNIQDFVDNLKLESFLNQNIDFNTYPNESFWSTISDISSSNNRNKQSSHSNLNVKISNNIEKKCFTKSLNQWQQEKCWAKHSYICEFNSIPVSVHRPNKKQSINNGNKLIRVACGSSSSSLFSSSFKHSPSSTTTTTTPKIKSNSIKNTQSPDLIAAKRVKQLQQQPSSTKAITSRSMSIFPSSSRIVSNYDVIDNENTKSEKIKSILLSNLNSKDDKKTNSGLFSNIDLALVIAMVSGASVVLIAVNIFCVWNYYNRKLKRKFNRTLTHNENTYTRTSTMKPAKNKIKSQSSSSNGSSNLIDTTNRTLTSTVDSYTKVPLNEPSCESSSSSSTLSDPIQSPILTNDFIIQNEKNIEFLKSYFNQTTCKTNGNGLNLNTNHYYETLSTRQQLNNTNNYLQPSNYNEYQCLTGPSFDQQQFVLVPASQIITTNDGQNGAQTILLLAAPQQIIQQQQQQPYSTIYSENLSPNSVSSNQPLLTFVNNSNVSNNNNNNNVNS